MYRIYINIPTAWWLLRRRMSIEYIIFYLFYIYRRPFHKELTHVLYSFFFNYILLYFETRPRGSTNEKKTFYSDRGRKKGRSEINYGLTAGNNP